jgi:hypothetical protein
MSWVPETISHEKLLVALDMTSLEIAAEGSIYRTQLRHRLLTLARKARLEVAAHEVTGLPPADLCSKTALELLALMDRKKGLLPPEDNDLFRRW